VSNYKKNRPKVLAQKVVQENWLRRMCGVLRIDFLKIYWSISGMSGHPVKIQKKMVLGLTLGCLMQKSVWHYLVPLKMALGQKVGVLKKQP
jgi:hypothetical protein